MTYIKCWFCNRFTSPYSDLCNHCGKSKREGPEIQLLYGVGGKPLPSNICRKCDFVNDYFAIECQECGRNLERQKLSKSEKEEIRDKILKELFGDEST